jgi:serine/threonine protein kinase
MLNRRGAEPDVVMVLDFGLVRALDEDKVARQTGGLAGTPLYMSPEAIQSPDAVDPRSDIYAVGAVGYFLVTGQPVFDAGTLVELCQKHLTTLPASPSERLGRNISAELENAILACLEKSPAKRPQTARDLAERLDRSVAALSWSLEDADSWWTRHERSKATSAANANDGSPSPLSGGTSMAAAPPASGNGTAPSAPPTRTTNPNLDQTIANPPGHRPA